MSAQSDKFVIIGNGSAAISALQAINAANPAAEITVVSQESYPCYSPTALHYLLERRIPEDKMWLRESSFYMDRNTRLLNGRKASVVNAENHKVTLDDGTELSFDCLLIATGASPVIPSIPGLEGPGVLTLRTLDDAKHLRELSARGGRVLILGAGLVGLQMAHAFRETGLQVVVVEKESQVLPLNLNSKAAEMIGACFSQHGVEVLTGRTLVGLTREKAGGRLIAELSDGGAISADFVLVAVGVRPNVDFLEGSGIAVRRGVVVDDRMQASARGVYAAGDVVEAPDFFTGEPSYNAILPAAVEQGDVAGTNMAGGAKRYAGNIPVNILRCWGDCVASVGKVSGPTTLEREWSGARRYQRLIVEDSQLVGGVFVNVAVDPGVILSLVRNRVELSEKDAELLVEAPGHYGRKMMLRQEGYLRQRVSIA